VLSIYRTLRNIFAQGFVLQTFAIIQQNVLYSNGQGIPAAKSVHFLQTQEYVRVAVAVCFNFLLFCVCTLIGWVFHREL